MKLQLDSIYFGRRMRQDYGIEDLQDLAADFRANGQITAITVSAVPDFVRAEEDYKGEEYLLCAGGRRYMAAGMAGWKDINAYIREAPSELEYRIWELHENLKRKAMSWQEEVEAKAEIVRLRKIQDPTLTDAQMAVELGTNVATMSRDLMTAKLIEEKPQLRKATSKHSALGAGKELRKHEARQILQDAAPKVNPAGPLKDRIFTSDAIAFVEKLPDASIDLGLLDGPYGYNYWKLGQKVDPRKNGSAISMYDDSPEAVGALYLKLFPQLIRVIRPTGWLVMFAGTETFILLQDLARNCCAVHAAYRSEADSGRCNGATQRGACRFLTPEPYPWIWYRPNSRNQPRHPHLHAKNVAELIFVCNMGRGHIVRQPAESVLVHDVEYGNIRVHVNQKPPELYKEIIERLTFTGDSVLDCFFGSGNSLAAAAELGRIPWGCDSNPEMLPFAIGRISAKEKPVSREEIQASLDRFRKALEGEPIAEPLEVEEQEILHGLLGTKDPYIVKATPGPRVKDELKKEVFSDFEQEPVYFIESGSNE